MTWARFDDLYDDNRKVKRAWRRSARAVGLHVMAITYSSRHETDGMIDIDWLEEKMPKDSERASALAVLVDVGLFELVDDEHYRVHDYLAFNPSREQLTSKRAADSKRKRESKDRGVQPESERNPDGIQTESVGSPDDASRDARAPAPPALPGPSLPGPSLPDPSQCPPDPPEGGRRRDQMKYGLEFNAWCAQQFPGVQPKLVDHCEAILRARGVLPTVENLRPLVANGGILPFNGKEAA